MSEADVTQSVRYTAGLCVADTGALLRRDCTAHVMEPSRHFVFSRDYTTLTPYVARVAGPMRRPMQRASLPNTMCFDSD